MYYFGYGVGYSLGAGSLANQYLLARSSMQNAALLNMPVVSGCCCAAQATNAATSSFVNSMSTFFSTW